VGCFLLKTGGKVDRRIEGVVAGLRILVISNPPKK
jgi:hypothetical protein